MSRSRRKRQHLRQNVPKDSRRVDLHMHSNLSDGRLSVEEILKLAALRGLDIICISDHDLAPVLEAKEYHFDSHCIRVIHGAEMSVDLEGEEQHFLAYFPDQMPQDFRDECVQISKNRALRYDALREMIGLEGVKPADEQAKNGLRSLTRLHLARAVIDAGHAKYVSEVFDRWLRGKEREDLFPKAKEMIQKIKDNGGVCIWAHPSIKKASLYAQKMKDYGMDGLEVYRPYIKKGERKRLKQLCNTQKMLCSGGSDSHDDSIGRFSFSASEIHDWPSSFSFPT